MTTTAKMVVDYIGTQMRLSGRTQLLKLLYYTQAWSLAWDGEPLFHDRIEAWEQGPVVVDAYYRRSPQGPALTPEQQATIDAVIDHYGRFYGKQLSDLTHEEHPWKVAWDARPDHASNRGQEEISLRDMRREYTRQSMAGRGPRRLAQGVKHLSDDEVRCTVERNAERWAEALALLAG
ncbi:MULTISPECIES: Panacea domain-containing protein [Arsenicicoccus]|uniref:Panacea domain-containing protein n=1 Tax=Arsenicicoccus TaxID=267408 RepID=UPI00257B4D00|nr:MULTISPECIES: type II toxin-antitoxin system antitoxin SocA domain-containing protein [Arsenicicoccus]